MVGEVSTTRHRRCFDPAAPDIERRGWHAHQHAHPADCICGLLRFDQRAALGYGCVLAKKAAAFFRNLFSIRSRRISAYISATRAASTDSIAIAGSGFFLRQALTQFASVTAVDSQVKSHISGRTIQTDNHLHSFSLELRTERATSLGHKQILPKRESLSKIIGTPHDGLLAHIPSGRFPASYAWVLCAASAHNLLRAAAPVNTPARFARPAGKPALHLPAHWPWPLSAALSA